MLCCRSDLLVRTAPGQLGQARDKDLSSESPSFLRVAEDRAVKDLPELTPDRGRFGGAGQTLPKDLLDDRWIGPWFG